VSSRQGGIELPWLVTIVFFILKVTGNIDWSWWWVFSPVWITFVVGVLLIFLGTLLTLYDDPTRHTW
jgi:hypothetical protein